LKKMALMFLDHALSITNFQRKMLTDASNEKIFDKDDTHASIVFAINNVDQVVKIINTDFRRLIESIKEPKLIKINFTQNKYKSKLKVVVAKAILVKGLAIQKMIGTYLLLAMKRSELSQKTDINESSKVKNSMFKFDLLGKIKDIFNNLKSIILKEELGDAAAEPVHTDAAPVEHTPEISNDEVYTTDSHEQAEDVKEVVVENVAGDTDLGDAAAEPVHTDKAAVEHTPELTNDDVYTSDEHEQAEEVDEVLVETVASLSDDDFNTFIGSLNEGELSLLESQFAAFVSERDYLIEGIIRGKSAKDFSELVRKDVKGIKQDRDTKIANISPSRKAAILAAREKSTKDYATTQAKLKDHISKIKGSRPKPGTPDYDRRFELIAKAKASQVAAKKAMNKERGFGIGNFRFGGDAAKRETERTRNLANVYKDEAKAEVGKAKDSFKKAMADDAKKTSLVSRAGAGLKKVGATINKLAGNTAAPAAPKAALIPSSSAADNAYLSKFSVGQGSKATTPSMPKNKDLPAPVKKAPKAKAFSDKEKKVINDAYNTLQGLSNKELRVLSEAVSPSTKEFEGKSYQEKFSLLLSKYGVKTPAALTGEDKKEFFSTLNRVHTSKAEAKKTQVKESVVIWSGKIRSAKINEAEVKSDTVGNQFDIDAANKVGFNSAKEDTEDKLKDNKAEIKAQPADITVKTQEPIETVANAVTPNVTNDDLLKDSEKAEDVKPVVTEAEVPAPTEIAGMNRSDIGNEADLFSGRIGRILKASLEPGLPKMSTTNPAERQTVIDLKDNAEFQSIVGKIKAQLDSSNPNYVMLQVLKRKAQTAISNYSKQ
jgi:hypothetical protein